MSRARRDEEYETWTKPDLIEVHSIIFHMYILHLIAPTIESEIFLKRIDFAIRLDFHRPFSLNHHIFSENKLIEGRHRRT